MYCEKCGKEILDNTDKCSFCEKTKENKMSDSCFTDDDYLVINICKVLAFSAALGIIIILLIVIEKNNYNTTNFFDEKIDYSEGYVHTFIWLEDNGNVLYESPTIDVI